MTDRVVICQECKVRDINTQWYPFCSYHCTALAINDGWAKVDGKWVKK